MVMRAYRRACSRACFPVVLAVAAVVFVIIAVNADRIRQHQAQVVTGLRAAAAVLLVLAAAGIVFGTAHLVTRQRWVTRVYDDGPDPGPVPAPDPGWEVVASRRPVSAAPAVPVPVPGKQSRPSRVIPEKAAEAEVVR